MFNIKKYNIIRLNDVNYYDYIGNLEYLRERIVPTINDSCFAEEIRKNDIFTSNYYGLANSILLNTVRKNRIVFAIVGNIGSGKSTFIHILFENNIFGSNSVLVLEDIYKNIFFDDIDKIKIAYGYAKSLVKKKILDCCNLDKNLIFEFVPSSNEKIEILDALKRIGYRIVIFFIKTDNISINVSRIKKRIDNGADYVSEDKVRSRESLTNGNINRLLCCSDEFYCYNSNEGSFLLFSYSLGGKEMIIVNEEKPT